jgi:predicted nucleic acid-binding protein
MNVYVVDASVAVKWFFTEAHTEDALRLRLHPHELRAPDYLWLEVASVVCQRIRRKQVLAEKGLRILPALRSLPVQIFPSSELLEAATDIALDTATSLYDSVYVALAVLSDARMVTADGRLYRNLSAGRFSTCVLWVGDIP